MLINQELVEKVKSLGLNSYEAKIWTALLSKGVATSGDLSDIANVPRSRSYDVLESLESKGFVVMKLGKPIKYIAVPPHEVIERLKQAIKHENEARARLLDEFKTTELFESLSVLHDTGIESVDPADLSGVVKGRKAIYQKIQELIAGAQSSVIIMLPAAEILKNKRPLLSGFKKNANRIRIEAHSDGEVSFDAFPLEYHAFKSPTRCIIVDEKDVIFMLMDSEKVHPNYDSAIWVKSEFFAKGLTSMTR